MVAVSDYYYFSELDLSSLLVRMLYYRRPGRLIRDTFPDATFVLSLPVPLPLLAYLGRPLSVFSLHHIPLLTPHETL